MLPTIPGMRDLSPWGAGTGPETYRATCDALGREVTLESFPAAVLRDAAVGWGLEALVAASPRLEHPALVRPLLVIPRPDGGVWLASEHVSGVTLAEALGRGVLEVSDALMFFEQLCEGLGQAHRAGVVHGDVRPEHVWLPLGPGELRPRLAGFGRALFGSPLGLSYAAPERLQGGAISVATDVFGLGAVLHALLTGGPPFAGRTMDEVLGTIRSDRSPALPSSASHLASVIRRCLSYEPAKRFASAHEVVEWAKRSNRTLVRSSGGGLSSPSQPAARAPPSHLGSYELLRLLGEGSMGQVYLARHTRLGRLVAIKVLHPDQYQRPELVQRFFQEARSVNHISHDHIVQIIDFVEELGPDGLPWVYTVMEHLEGQTFGALLEAGPVSIARGVRIVRQVCDALEAAHSVGVVHRDLKPDNIFLVARAGQGDFVKVLDFGVAKLVTQTLEAPSVSTVDGAIIGTPVFMSPEQAAGRPVDRRTDVYAAGVMLYRLLAGRLPFDGASFGVILAAVIGQPPPPLPRAAASGEPVPPALAKVVLRCLAKDPGERLPSMAAVRAALEPFETAQSEASVPPRRRWRWRWALAAVIMAIGGGGVLAATHLGLVSFPRRSVVDEVPLPVERLLVALPPVGPAEEVAEVAPSVVRPHQPSPVEKPTHRPAGPLTAAEIGATLKKAGRDINRCLERHRAQLPGGEGELVVTLTIEPSGKVSRARVSETLSATPLGDCLSREGARLRFPTHRGRAVTVNVPFAYRQE